ncbi:MAG: hypothetical protein IT270_07185 [Saprospiraceae bacterium]|nr:hypothetical protein [Saprospiraceae bacterium]
MRLERYSGIYSAAINPANTAFTPHNWEISLFNADAFFENSYAYLNNTSIPNALRNSDRIVAASDTSMERPLMPGDILMSYADGDKPMHGVMRTAVYGPSFSARIAEDHVVGLTFGVRSLFSAYKIPEVLAYNSISNVPIGQTLVIPRTRGEGLAMAEIALHYSFRNTYKDVYTAWGVTPKILLGFEGFYTDAASEFDYTPEGNDSTTFGRSDWNYALTTGNLTSNSDDIKLKQQGAGVGVDFGWVWAMPADDADTDEDYDWKFGISLIDLGFLTFGKGGEKHRIYFQDSVTVSGDDFPGTDDPYERIRQASQAFLGDPTASLQKKSFVIGMPTALSVQLDKRVTNGFYINTILMQRFTVVPNSIHRPSTLATVPRYEKKWYSISVPLVINDWRSFRVGLSARIGFLYFGTDNVGSLMEKAKQSGSDFYIGLKFNALTLSGGKFRGFGGGGGRPSRQKMRKIKCYEF